MYVKYCTPNSIYAVQRQCGAKLEAVMLSWSYVINIFYQHMGGFKSSNVIHFLSAAA